MSAQKEIGLSKDYTNTPYGFERLGGTTDFPKAIAEIQSRIDLLVPEREGYAERLRFLQEEIAFLEKLRDSGLVPVQIGSAKVLATPGQARIYAAKRERDCILKHLQRSLKKKKEEESFVELDLPGRLITTALVRLREAEDSVAFFEAELKIKNANLARARQESEPGYDHDFYQTLLEYKTIDGNGFYFMINTKAWEGGCESDDGYHLPF